MSAGVRGVDLELAVGDLLAVTGGRLVEMSGRGSSSDGDGEGSAG